MMQVTLPHSVCPRGCRLPARGQRQASRPAAAADTAEAAAAASVEGAIYDGVFPKPLGVKFARGGDGGAYVISKSAEEAYAQFNVGDKILEVRRVLLQATRTATLLACQRGCSANVGACGRSALGERTGGCCRGHQWPAPHPAPPRLLPTSASFGPEVWKAENYGQGACAAWPPAPCGALL
jgi:hypothetical protein